MKNETEETGLSRPIRPAAAPLANSDRSKIVTKGDRKMARENADDSTVLDVQQAMQVRDRNAEANLDEAAAAGINDADDFTSTKAKAYFSRQKQNEEKLGTFVSHVNQRQSGASINDAVDGALDIPSIFDSPKFQDLFG